MIKPAAFLPNRIAISINQLLYPPQQYLLPQVMCVFTQVATRFDLLGDVIAKTVKFNSTLDEANVHRSDNPTGWDRESVIFQRAQLFCRYRVQVLRG
ncbi:hypothetical protein [Candidatus Nitrotoga sp. AM1P]|uniref:hypothetical protein n=1 Tax=Candidatus Nitrotoga sp. AM1P TaxID=2559597 RepID=UPI0015672A93|nr:hypothetical protein [Candidatus Nitrotoga sp. AM1P]